MRLRARSSQIEDLAWIALATLVRHGITDPAVTQRRTCCDLV
jgi:hypothetical protein